MSLSNYNIITFLLYFNTKVTFVETINCPSQTKTSEKIVKLQKLLFIQADIPVYYHNGNSKLVTSTFIECF